MLITCTGIELASCGLDKLREEVKPEGLGEMNRRREGEVDPAVLRLADSGTRGLHPRGAFSLRDAQPLHPKELAFQEHLPASIHYPHDVLYCIIYNNTVKSAVPPFFLHRQYSLSVPKPADKCIQSPQTATLFREYVPYWEQSSTPIFVSLSA